MISTYYPKGPDYVPAGLTRLPTSYKFKAALAIFAIFLFFFLYTAMVLGLGWMAYLALTYDMVHINKGTVLLKIGAIAGSIMLFVFTLKFIFKLKNHRPENRIKLKKAEQPELWNFVERICEETGAPKPGNIYIDPDVNAYVSYSNMWLSLFFPVKKDLTIGFGLTGALNLSEFKAVTAHEFGHFAQRSMKIGSYIISANTIIHDMIFTRDKWDNVLHQWRQTDIRLSAAAWVITPVIWLIRQILNLFYQFLNIMYSTLSREMEFNADKVAVSTAGSDAIVSALWKLDHGLVSWNETMNHAYLAAQKKIFTANLYQHNNNSLQRIAPRITELLNNLPADHRGGKKFFSSSENSKVGMYSSHPPNDHRENNAKIPYVQCVQDERSPWILFSGCTGLQEQMTKLIYSQYLNKVPSDFTPSAEFEEFVEAERLGNELQAEYRNTFVNRFVYIPLASELERSASALNATTQLTLEKLKADLEVLMDPVEELEALMLKIQEIANGTSKERKIEYKGLTYEKDTLQQGFERILAAREKLFETTFRNWDISFFTFHYGLANKLGKASELTNLYTQHITLSNFYRALSNTRNTIIKDLQVLQNHGEVTQEQINSFGERINSWIQSLNNELDRFNTLTFVPLPNIATLQELKEAVVEGGRFNRETGPIFENGGFDRILQSLESAGVHCQRLDQKSIGTILLKHKSLQELLN